MALDWNSYNAAQFNPLETLQVYGLAQRNAIERQDQQRKADARRAVHEGLASGDLTGAANALIEAGEYQGANALASLAKSARDQASDAALGGYMADNLPESMGGGPRSAPAAAPAPMLTAPAPVAPGQPAPMVPGAPADAPNPDGDIVVNARPAPPTPAALIRQYGPDMAKQILTFKKQLGDADEATRKQAEAHGEIIATLVPEMQKIPEAQRPAFIEKNRAMLNARGVTDAELEALDLSDAALPRLYTLGLGLKVAAKMDQDERQFQQTKAQQQQFHGDEMRDHAASRAVSLRGQNMSHADANSAPLLTPQAIELQAQQVANGGDLPALGLGRAGAQLKAQILNRAAQIAGENGNDGAEMNLIKASRKANMVSLQDLTKRNGVMTAAKNTAVSNGDLLIHAASTGAGTSGSPLLNRWQQAYRSGGQGSPEVAKFGLAINTFANEYAKVVSGATGAAGVTEGARQEMLHHLSTASTPQQVAAIVRQAKLEMASSTNAMQGQIGQTRQSMRSAGKKAPQGRVIQGNGYRVVTGK